MRRSRKTGPSRRRSEKKNLSVRIILGARVKATGRMRKNGTVLTGWGEDDELCGDVVWLCWSSKYQHCKDEGLEGCTKSINDVLMSIPYVFACVL